VSNHTRAVLQRPGTHEPASKAAAGPPETCSADRKFAARSGINGFLEQQILRTDGELEARAPRRVAYVRAHGNALFVFSFPVLCFLATDPSGPMPHSVVIGRGLLSGSREPGRPENKSLQRSPDKPTVHGCAEDLTALRLSRWDRLERHDRDESLRRHMIDRSEHTGDGVNLRVYFSSNARSFVRRLSVIAKSIGQCEGASRSLRGAICDHECELVEQVWKIVWVAAQHLISDVEKMYWGRKHQIIGDHRRKDDARREPNRALHFVSFRQDPRIGIIWRL